MKNINQHEDINANPNQKNSNKFVIVKKEMGFENKDLIRIKFSQNKENCNLNLRIIIEKFDDNNNYLDKNFYPIENKMESIPIGKSKKELKPSDLMCKFFDPIVIDDNTISRYHCEILKKEKEYFLRGKTSSNFTYRFIKPKEYLILSKKTILEIKIKNVSSTLEIKDLSKESTDINTNIPFTTIKILINETREITLSSKDETFFLNFDNNDQIYFDKINKPTPYQIHFDQKLKQFIFSFHENLSESGIWVRLVEDISMNPIYDISLCHGDIFRLARNCLLKVEMC